MDSRPRLCRIGRPCCLPRDFRKETPVSYSIDLSGRVVYHAGESQTGVRFIYREGGGSRRLRELVRRFKTL